MRPTRAVDGTAPTVERRAPANEVGLRLFAGSVLVIAIGVAAFGLFSGPPINWRSFVALAALLVFAEHRDRLFGDQTSVSGSIVVSMAAVVAFSNDAWLAGPMLCAGLAGAYWPHLRARAWSRVAVNTSSMGLAAGAAAATLHLLGTGARGIGYGEAVAGVAALVAFWTVNSVVLGIAVALIQRRGVWVVCTGLLGADLELLAFGYGGFLAGLLVVNASLWVGLLGIVVLLVGLDVLVTRRVGRGRRRLVVSGACAFAVLGYLAWLAADHATRSSADFLVVVCLGLAASVVATRRREEFRRFAGLLALGATLVSAGTRGSYFAPLVVMFAVYGIAIVRSRNRRGRLLLVTAVGLASLCSTAAVDALPRVAFASPWGSLLIGAIASLAALVGWHAALGSNLIIEVGARGLSAVAGIVRDELLSGIFAGVCGAMCGWLGFRFGVVPLAISLTAVLVGAFIWVGRSHNGNRQIQPPLSDEELADVIQSALLDLPASSFRD